ncbi:MAG: lactonase family protein [Steroidobacteraceae bacterium]
MFKIGITRREFISRTAAALAVPFASSSVRSAVAPASLYGYVGTYTPNGGGIYLFRIDRSSGALTQIQVVDDTRNPSWIAVNPAQTRLYAISEIDNYQGTHSGAVVTYAIDADTFELRRLGAVASGGPGPAYVSVHPSGKYVFVANYGGGSVAVFPVAEDGTLGTASDVRPSVGPRHHPHAIDDPPGQFAVSDHEGPHVHMVASDPSGQFVIANDAGLDLTLVWRLDMQAGRLLPSDTPVVEAPSGSAPRHFVFHPSGKYFYNLYEHDCKVAVYDYDASRGAMRLKQSVSTLPPKFAGSNLAAEILVSPDGRFLYVSNRLHSTLAVFAIAADGQLKMTSETWVHADYPRSAAIDPSGEIIFSCNQKGDSITSFRVNPASGALAFTGRFEPVGSPAVMVMLKPR